MNAWWLREEIARRGEIIGSQYDSDMFHLLACIFAYYEAKGTPAEAMLVGNDAMRRAIDSWKAEAARHDG